MNTKNWPAKLLLVVGVLACASAMCGGLGAGVTAPVAGVVEEWSPRNVGEVNATATAVPLSLNATRTHQDRVLPTQQAVEAQEIVETTQRRYANARTASNAWLWLRIGVGATALGGVLVFVGSASVKEIKRAVEYEPVQVVPEKPLYFPRRKMLVDPRTGRVWAVLTEHRAGDDPAHGRLLIERMTGKRGASWRGVPRNERHPVTLDAWAEGGRHLIEEVRVD